MRDRTVRDPSLDHILGDLAKLLQWAYHDGFAEPHKDFWDWEVPEFKDIWERITDPANVAALERYRGASLNADGSRMFEEAYKQALARCKL
jgi:hypothetical protein